MLCSIGFRNLARHRSPSLSSSYYHFRRDSFARVSFTPFPLNSATGPRRRCTLPFRTFCTVKRSAVSLSSHLTLRDPGCDLINRIIGRRPTSSTCSYLTRETHDRDPPRQFRSRVLYTVLRKRANCSISIVKRNRVFPVNVASRGDRFLYTRKPSYRK